jgi:hypothetical protein
MVNSAADSATGMVWLVAPHIGWRQSCDHDCGLGPEDLFLEGCCFLDAGCLLVVVSLLCNPSLVCGCNSFYCLLGVGRFLMRSVYASIGSRRALDTCQVWSALRKEAQLKTRLEVDRES